MLQCYFLLQLCFLQCARGKLDSAQSSLKEVEKIQEQMSEQSPLDIRSQVRYLQGAVHQASGNLNEALAAYQHPDLALSSTSMKTPHGRTHFNICILSVLNTVVIIRNPRHRLHSQLGDKLNWLSSVVPASNSKNTTAAYNLMLAVLPDFTHLQVKQYLSRSLDISKEVSNHQIMSITLGTMSWKWFQGVVGDQALKGSLAFHAEAKKSGNPMWVSVADGILSDTFDRKIGRASCRERV